MRLSLVQPEPLAEKDWDGLLFAQKDGLATTLGWETYHTLRSKGSTSGYPDRTLVRERIVFAELKTDEKASKPTDRQREWLDKLARAGGEVYLWRPRDFDEVSEILARRWVFSPGDEKKPPTLATVDGAWTPGSAWIPGYGRAETLAWWVAEVAPPRSR